MEAAFAIALVVIPMAIFIPWFFQSKRNTKKRLNYLIAHPEQILSMQRSGPDGDGYDRLYVKTRDGKELVVGHFDAADAEKRLKSALAA